MEVDTAIINMEIHKTIKRDSDSLTYTSSKLRTFSADARKPEGVIGVSFMVSCRKVNI